MLNKTLSAIIVILVGVGLFYFGYSYSPSLSFKNNTGYTSNTSKQTVSMLIDDGKIITGFDNQTIPPDEPTVFGLLKQVTTTNNIKLEYDPASSNSFNAVFIKQIGEKKNSTNAAYWQYWVDGSQPPVGADHYNLTGGEAVLWTFRLSAM